MEVGEGPVGPVGSGCEGVLADERREEEAALDCHLVERAVVQASTVGSAAGGSIKGTGDQRVAAKSIGTVLPVSEGNRMVKEDHSKAKASARESVEGVLEGREVEGTVMEAGKFWGVM